MPKLNRCAIAIFTILSAISSPTLLANINEPSGEAADIISQVADSHAIKYYNAADWQAEDNALPSLAELRDLVINQQKRVLVDFSQISDAEGQAEMQAQFRKAYGVVLLINLLSSLNIKGNCCLHLLIRQKRLTLNYSKRRVPLAY